MAGSGIIYLFEDWLRPHIDRGALVPVLQPWWLSFPGPFLYYPSRRHLPTPLRAFVDFVKSMQPTLSGQQATKTTAPRPSKTRPGP